MQINESDVRARYERITRSLIATGTTITTMESCTAGQLASLITDTEGSSAIIKGAYVTYSNEAKVMQGVPQGVIDHYGVYSTQTAEAMARACRESLDAQIGVGVTGSFGNTDPANADSVPGEVFFSLATADSTQSWHVTVPPQPTRFAYKLYMADAIASKLEEMLQ